LMVATPVMASDFEFSSDNMAFRNINDQQALDELSKYLCP